MSESFLDFSLRPQPRRRLVLLIAILLCVAGGWGVYVWKKHEAAYSHLGPTPSSGGKFFKKRIEIAVPLFMQGDDLWSEDKLGPTDGTLGAEGCAVCSAAMVLKSYGFDTDPKRLNEYLTANEGYTPEGWIFWEKAAEIGGGKVRHAYEDPPSFKLIDENLLRGNPVIIRVRMPGGTTHFVVIAGKEGYDYLIRDPGGRGAGGLYPLKELVPQIEALRFYEKTGG